MKRIAIVGMGAVGTTFASRFEANGYDVTVICDLARKSRYEKYGFVINGKAHGFTCSTVDEYDGEADLVIIAVKYQQLVCAINELGKIINRKSIVLSLMNGIDSEEIIRKQISNGNIINSIVTDIDAIRKDNFIEYSLGGKIIFGEASGEISEYVYELENIFKFCNIDYEVSKNVIKSMWWKFMVNVGVNQLSAVLGAPYGVFKRNVHVRSILKEVMLEVVEVANAMDIDLSEEDVDYVLGMYEGFDDEKKTSMLQDVLAKRNTEVEMLAGKVCELGKEIDIATPHNYMLYKLIKSIESLY
jgi:2-dehydropantoate 2-reductase